MSIALDDVTGSAAEKGRHSNGANEGHEEFEIAEDDAGETDSSDDDGDGDDDEGDEDAEEIARRLGDQLWADIQKARGVGAPATAPQPTVQSTKPAAVPIPSPSSKEAAAITTMKTVLAYAAAEPLVYSTLSSTFVPGFEKTNVLEILTKIVESGRVSPQTAGPLSQVIVKLAKSEALFSPLPTIPTQLKRKRDDVENSATSAPPTKRVSMPVEQVQDLQSQLAKATSIVANALSSDPTSNVPLDPSVIASIQFQLHQVFLFAVTSSASPVFDPNSLQALQEISGLIQILGILSGIQIAPSVPQDPSELTAPASDIGTAVYPCTLPACGKTFARLFSLRQHQQRAHLFAYAGTPGSKVAMMMMQYRPYKCAHCPASFARNHDRKRHAKSHDRRAYKCLGPDCGKMFSRRDALKRHRAGTSRAKPGARAPTPGNSCEDAETEEVMLEGTDLGLEDAREGRRAKLWSGISSKPGPEAVGAVPVDSDGLEEGELPPAVLARAQAAVTGLYSMLQVHVTNALSTVSPGAGHGNALPAPDISMNSTSNTQSATTNANTGPMTLASVIARATAGASAVDESSPHNLASQPSTTPTSLPSNPEAPGLSVAGISGYVLSTDQTALLEQAIASATAAAQAQAEAEAALEEGDGDSSNEDDEDDEEEDEEMMDINAGDP